MSNKNIKDIIEKAKTIILGDGVVYPNNAGCIFRAAVVLGANGVFFSTPDQEVYDHLVSKDDRKKRIETNIRPITKHDRTEYGLSSPYVHSRHFMDGVDHFSQRQKASSVFCEFNVSSEEVLLEALKCGFTVCALENYGTKSIHEVPLGNEKVLFIVGNEKVGIGRIVTEMAIKRDIHFARIPTFDDETGIESLNVGQVIGIALVERNRQRSQVIKILL